MKDDSRIDVMLAEHNCLQEKIRHASADLYRTETVIPLAIAVAYAWLFGEGAAMRWVPELLVWVPVTAALYGAVRQYLRYQSLGAMHEYVRDLERELYPRGTRMASPVRGWETRWLDRPGHWRAHMTMRGVFWAVLLAVTILVAWRYPFESPSGSFVVRALAPSSGGANPFEAPMSEISISIIIAALSIFFSSCAVAFAASRNYKGKRQEIAGNYKMKLIELAVTTANSEFSSSKELLARAKIQPRPMSLYVIFHFLLFKRLDELEIRTSPGDILQEVFDEIDTTFEVYQRSGYEEFGAVWNVQSPAPKRSAASRPS